MSVDAEKLAHTLAAISRIQVVAMNLLFPHGSSERRKLRGAIVSLTERETDPTRNKVYAAYLQALDTNDEVVLDVAKK